MVKNLDAEVRINKIITQFADNLNLNTAYKILDCSFQINSNNIYPPGKLTEMFANFLLEQNLCKNNIIADIGCGCFAVGIIAARHSAKQVIGTDLNPFAIECAKENIIINKVQANTAVFHAEELRSLIPQFNGKFDVLLSGIPWDNISSKDFNIEIMNDRKYLSRALYDVDDKLILSIIQEGQTLLSPKGRIFITSSDNKLSRIEALTNSNNIKMQIVYSKDIHQDKNMHHIIELIY